MDYKKKLHFEKKAKNIIPTAIIGKDGIKPPLLEEISSQLEKKELVKVKIRGAFAKNKNKKQIAEQVAMHTNSEFISIVGFVFLLYKKQDIVKNKKSNQDKNFKPKKTKGHSKNKRRFIKSRRNRR